MHTFRQGSVSVSAEVPWYRVQWRDAKMTCHNFSPKIDKKSTVTGLWCFKKNGKGLAIKMLQI